MQQELPLHHLCWVSISVAGSSDSDDLFNVTDIFFTVVNSVTDSGHGRDNGVVSVEVVCEGNCHTHSAKWLNRGIMTWNFWYRGCYVFLIRSSLSSLLEGLSGWGKVIPTSLLALSVETWTMCRVQFCMQNWSWTITGVDRHGSMGSGLVFSLLASSTSECAEAWDIWLLLETRVCNRGERGWELEWHLAALFMCELGSEFKLWNSAISSQVFSISLALTHWLSKLGYPFHFTKYCFFFQSP